MLVAAELELAVVELPAGSDPDELLRSEGSDAFRSRLGRAEHWLSWELQLLLAPFHQSPEDLAVLQRCETAGRRLLAVLPAGPLRRRAEETLRRVLGEAPQAPVPDPQAQAGRGRAVDSRIARAEWRALRLFIATPASRPLLGGLHVQTLLHRRAMEHLQEVWRRLPQQPVVPERDPLAEILLALSSRMEPELAELLRQLCRSAQQAQHSLGCNLAEEVKAVLDVLEPVGHRCVAPREHAMEADGQANVNSSQ